MAEAFATIIGSLPSYYDGVLSRPVYTDNGKGTMTHTDAEAPIRVQVDRVTQAMRADGYADDDVRLIVMASGIGQYLDSDRVQDDDLVSIPELNATYMVAHPSFDPLMTHWDCGGRIKPVAVP